MKWCNGHLHGALFGDGEPSPSEGLDSLTPRREAPATAVAFPELVLWPP